LGAACIDKTSSNLLALYLFDPAKGEITTCSKDSFIYAVPGGKPEITGVPFYLCLSGGVTEYSMNTTELDATAKSTIWGGTFVLNGDDGTHSADLSGSFRAPPQGRGCDRHGKATVPPFRELRCIGVAEAGWVPRGGTVRRFLVTCGRRLAVARAPTAWMTDTGHRRRCRQRKDARRYGQRIRTDIDWMPTRQLLQARVGRLRLHQGCRKDFATDDHVGPKVRPHTCKR
jgi:hypothetical protein